MKNFIQTGNKKIEISKETAINLREQFSQKETPSEEVAIGGYEFMRNIDWDKQEEILIKDKPEKKIFVNKKFADNSEFGDCCVFIKCEFGSYCEFDSDCKKQTPYWDENGKHE